jgi:hypothetical protein
MATGKKVGRPKGTSPYANKEQIKTDLVAWIAQGKTLREFCRQDGMPSNTVLYDWEREDAEFASRIAHARETGHDAIADECAALADTEPLAVFDEQGNKRYDPGSIAWRKNQIETRLKLLAKWNPRKYGDKTVLAGDPDAPVKIAVDFVTFDAMLSNLELLRHDGQPS